MSNTSNNNQKVFYRVSQMNSFERKKSLTKSL